MKRLLLTEQNIKEAVQEACAVLAKGGLVIYPTETVYGIGCDATNPAAVSKLLKYKQRPPGKAISVLVATKELAAQLVEINPHADQIFARFLPGPVTVVCKDKGEVDARLLSEWHNLGIRLSSHPLAAALAKAYGKPITSTSANAAGAARPYAIDHLLARLSEHQKGEIDLILDVGTLPTREPSTVIDTTTDTQQILRAGAEVESLAPPFTSHSEAETQQFAADLLRQHAHVIGEKALVFALEGELGAGKTQLAKGFGQSLGITQPITSPTYVLVKEYPAFLAERPVQFTHMDLWRLENVNPEELGLSEYLQPHIVTVIEWAAPLYEHLRTLQERAVVHRIFIEGDNERTIKLLPL